MEKYTPEVFEFEIGGYEYTVEFCREGMREADAAGVASNDSMGNYDRIRTVLYAGLKKHHPFITMKRAGEIVEQALDEGYGLDSFADIVDEFLLCYKATFTESGEGKKKKLISRRSEVAKGTSGKSQK